MQPIIIKNHQVRIEPGAPASVGPDGATSGVRLLEEDGVVHALELRCACGEVTVVELEYTDARAKIPACGGGQSDPSGDDDTLDGASDDPLPATSPPEEA